MNESASAKTESDVDDYISYGILKMWNLVFPDWEKNEQDSTANARSFMPTQAPNERASVKTENDFDDYMSVETRKM